MILLNYAIYEINLYIWSFYHEKYFYMFCTLIMHSILTQL